MKRIAAPMIGGMITSTILTLVIIPTIYELWKGRRLRSEAPMVREAAELKESLTHVEKP